MLIPQMLREILLSAAEAGLYHAFWSRQILEELRRNLGPAGGVAPERVDRVISTMQAAFPAAMVAPWPSHKVDLLRNDPGDRHVLATAIESGAQVIVTHNTRHFSQQDVGPHGIEALTPDDFLLRLLDARRGAFLAVIREISAALVRPHLTPGEVVLAVGKFAPRFSAAAMDALG